MFYEQNNFRQDDRIRQETTSGGNGMNCRLRNAALLLLILVLGTGLAMAQPGLKVTESDGSTFNFTPSAVAAHSPTPGPTGPDGLPRYKYWDALGSSNAGTDYYNFSQANVTAPPN